MMASEESPMTGPKPFVFVLMPFSTEFSDIYTYGIKGAAEDVGAYAERIDEQIFDEGILERIFNQINKADVIVADMTNRNANVFYEVGYAHALNKVVVLLTQNADDIPFDLKHRPHIVYGGKIGDLHPVLTQRLAWAIGEVRRRGQQPVVQSRLTVSLHGVELPEFSTGAAAPIVSTFTLGSRGQHTNLHWDFIVRNEGPEVLEPIAHICLFTEAGIVEMKSYTPPKTSRPIDASRADQEKLGLSNQFMLPYALPSLPPGAVKLFQVSSLSLTHNSQQARDFGYCIAFFTQTRPYYFPFRIRIEYEGK